MGSSKRFARCDEKATAATQRWGLRPCPQIIVLSWDPATGSDDSWTLQKRPPRREAQLVVGSQSFSDPQVVLMVIVVAIVGLIILMP